MPRLGIVIAALVAGGIISLIFKAMYPSVQMSPSVALLFGLIGLFLVFGLRAIWLVFRSKPE